MDDRTAGPAPEGTDPEAGEPAPEIEREAPPEAENEAQEAAADGPAAPRLNVVPDGAPLEARLEALLFVSAAPVRLRRLAEAAGCSEAAAREALRDLDRSLEAAGRAVRVHEIAEGFQLLTRPEFSEWIARLKRSREAERLSPSALETLAIVAYRQPVIRAEIEAVRGVQCGPVLRTLLDRRLVRVAGRDQRPGNPILYRTTRQFLEHFGLASLKDLPAAAGELPPPGKTAGTPP